jgi:transcriptional regulator with XRE-family HTH domain
VTKVALEVSLLEQARTQSVESLIEAKEIGQRIRRLRLKRSMGLVELGMKTNLSASFLSQLETGRVVPTLRNLARLAMVFQKDMAYFFHENTTAIFRISHLKDRVSLPSGTNNAPVLISDSLGSLIPNRRIVPVVTDFFPHSVASNVYSERFNGTEFIYVVRGEMTISRDKQVQIIGAADVLWIDGSVDRQYRCHGTVPAKALVFAFPTSSKTPDRTLDRLNKS